MGIKKNTQRVIQGHFERSIVGLPIDFISFQKQSVKYGTFSSRIITILITEFLTCRKCELPITGHRKPRTTKKKKTFFLRKGGGGGVERLSAACKFFRISCSLTRNYLLFVVNRLDFPLLFSGLLSDIRSIFGVFSLFHSAPRQTLALILTLVKI